MNIRSLALALCVLLLSCATGVGPEGGGDSRPDAAGDMATAGRVPRKHRPMAQACPLERPPGPPGIGRGNCQMDSECTDAQKGKNGRCVFSRIGGICSYDTCFSDSECAATSTVCLCREEAKEATAQANHCLSEGNCRTDAECGAAGYCSPSFGSCGNYLGVVAYYCHTPQDECIDDEDCTAMGGLSGPGYCGYDPVAKRWKCAYVHCVG